MASVKTNKDNSIGRVPPHNNEAEVALLGSILLKNKVLDEVQNLVSGDDFYQEGHKKIYNGIVNLRSDKPNLSIDIMSLSQYMSQKGTLSEAGGAAYIASLTDSVPSTTNASYYAELIRNNSIKRKLFDLSSKITDAVFDETKDAQQTLENVEQQISALEAKGLSSSYFDIKTLVTDAVSEIQNRVAGKTSIGVSSGFKTLDKYIGGFKPSELVIIAARPSVGKTALALSIAINMAFSDKNSVPIGFFSLEMSGGSLIERIFANKGQINLMSLRNGKMDADSTNRLITIADFLYNNGENLQIQDTPNMNLLDIKSQARKMVRDNNVKAIFIDYIGLIEYKAQDAKGVTLPKHQQVGEISKALKQLARELEVPIICLCQVGRDAGKDRAPMLADLRDSGSIEQDADLVILLDDASKRMDENGKVAQYEEEAENEAFDARLKQRPIKLIIAKQRNGSTGAFNMNFVSDYVQFREIEKF